MPKKFYAVRAGRAPGVYDTWAQCQKQTSGFSGAVFKSFPTREEAESFLSGGEAEADTAQPDPEGATAYVDGSYDSATGDFSCGAVLFLNGGEITFQSVFTTRSCRVCTTWPGR